MGTFTQTKKVKHKRLENKLDFHDITSEERNAPVSNLTIQSVKNNR